MASAVIVSQPMLRSSHRTQVIEFIRPALFQWFDVVTRERAIIGRWISEAEFPLDIDHVRRIASAQSVRVRLTGRREFVQRSFSAKNIARFKAFLDADSSRSVSARR